MQTNKMLNILLLAAGSSSRLGEPKQLLIFHENALIYHAASRALELTSYVTVVLGHESQKCRDALKNLPVTLVVNENYKAGMGNSIAFGASKLNDNARVLIMLCDQPLISLSHYNSLIQTSALYPDMIVASKYKTNFGVPALFPNCYLAKLRQLEGDKGAKAILQNEPLESVPLDVNEAKDIDTQEAWIEVSKLYAKQ